MKDLENFIISIKQFITGTANNLKTILDKKFKGSGLIEVTTETIRATGDIEVKLKDIPEETIIGNPSGTTASPTSFEIEGALKFSGGKLGTYEGTAHDITNSTTGQKSWSGAILRTQFNTKTESLNQFVGLSGVQDIVDTKTFLDSPVVPNPTLDAHAVNKGWVEDRVKFARYKWTYPHKFVGIINFPTEVFNSNLTTSRANNNERLYVEEGYYNVNATFNFLRGFGASSVGIFMNGSTQAHRIASNVSSSGEYSGCSTNTGVIYIDESDYISVGVESSQSVEDLVVEISFEKIR